MPSNIVLDDVRANCVTKWCINIGNSIFSQLYFSQLYCTFNKRLLANKSGELFWIFSDLFQSTLWFLVQTQQFSVLLTIHSSDLLLHWDLDTKEMSSVSLNCIPLFLENPGHYFHLDCYTSLQVPTFSRSCGNPERTWRCGRGQTVAGPAWNSLTSSCSL